MNFKQIADDVAGARLVGIGESTHGTHEFFMTKLEIFKHLVEEHAFDTLMFEDSPEVCNKIDDYIKTGVGDLSGLINDLYSVWRVQEVVNLINWLRENRTKYSVDFVGFDIDQKEISQMSRRDALMANNIGSYVKSSPGSKILIWAHNSHIKLSSQVKEYKPMGMLLKQVFTNDYLAIAQFFGVGQFNATHIDENKPQSKDRTLRPVTVSHIPAGLLENKLNSLSKQPFYLHKSELSYKRLPVTSTLVRSVGWGLVPSRLNEYVEKCDLSQEFDGLIYHPKTTPSQPIN